MPNQLIHETSPYLLQHAENPVNWFPWGEEALKKAREENKPIFLSIGYSACHWCHVMAHESFEDPQIARLLNDHFVSIKVDREERPDLDSIYMNAVVAMTGQGGWPMSVFLTPQTEPFYGGTYFPPTRRYGMPSFGEVLRAIVQSWENESSEILRVGRDLAKHLHETSAWTAQPSSGVRPEVIEQAAQALIDAYDWNVGGWGRAPLFPQPMALEFLLLAASRGQEKALETAGHALERMSRGGMYDVVGGGFHRYSTDSAWLVPHFEKMLYDNAQLAQVYLHAYLVTGKAHFRRVCTETLDFLLREMTHPEGGFFSSLDADSEGEEGKFYTWTKAEVDQALAAGQDRELFSRVYPLSPTGNFEGKHILQRTEAFDRVAAQVGLTEDELSRQLDGIHHKLYQARSARVRPLTDDKVLVSWNALALRAFAEAARYLNREDYLEAARNNARFLLSACYRGTRLLRAWRDGSARHNAYLEDYAGLILGLLELYQSDPDITWYEAAVRLAEDMLANFRDPQGGFFDTREDHGELITRPKDIQDNATPAGNALAAGALLRLSAFSERPDLNSIAEDMLGSVQNLLVQHPTAFAYWLQDLDFAVGPVRQIAVVGPRTDSQTVGMIEHVWHAFRPRTVLAAAEPAALTNAPGLLRDRNMIQGKTTVYICEGFTCNFPINTLQGLKEQLD